MSSTGKPSRLVNRIPVIFNPIAGGGRLLRHRPALDRAAEIQGAKLEWWSTDSPGHAADLAADAAAEGRRLLNDRWSHIQELCRAHEAPGRFVPFLGYEWTNFRYGHHNVYYLDYDQPIRMPPTLPELYASLKDVDALKRAP